MAPAEERLQLLEISQLKVLKSSETDALGRTLARRVVRKASAQAARSFGARFSCGMRKDVRFPEDNAFRKTQPLDAF